MASQVPAADQVLRVLRHLAVQAGPVPAAGVARALSLPRSTTYHLLAVLRDQGFVTYLPDQRRYGLGVTAFEVGSAYVRHDPLEHLARPLVAALAHRADVTVHLGVLHGRETLYLLKEQPPHHPVLVTDIGVRLPAQLTASGRALLAGLPRRRCVRCSPRLQISSIGQVRVPGARHSCGGYSPASVSVVGPKRMASSPQVSRRSPPLRSTTCSIPLPLSVRRSHPCLAMRRSEQPWPPMSWLRPPRSLADLAAEPRRGRRA